MKYTGCCTGPGYAIGVCGKGGGSPRPSPTFELDVIRGVRIQRRIRCKCVGPLDNPKGARKLRARYVQVHKLIEECTASAVAFSRFENSERVARVRPRGPNRDGRDLTD